MASQESNFTAQGNFPNRGEVALTRVVRVGLHGLDALGPQGELRITVVGVPDSKTGYLIGIQEIDRLARQHVAPRIQRALAAGTPVAARELAAWAALLQPLLPAGIRVATVAWSPHRAYQLSWSITMPETALLSRLYEFAASHRLHCAELTEADNRRIFGKCNSPNGHGHNYRLEVCVRTALGGNATPVAVADIDGTVESQVLRRLDHTHLNLDVSEFQDLNPSVENIAAMCYRWLQGPLANAGAALQRVTVWETEKTSATFPAP